MGSELLGGVQVTLARSPAEWRDAKRVARQELVGCHVEGTRARLQPGDWELLESDLGGALAGPPEDITARCFRERYAAPYSGAVIPQSPG
jgi:hypothetical protein